MRGKPIEESELKRGPRIWTFHDKRLIAQAVKPAQTRRFRFMRKRRNVAPRLELMEERAAPSFLGIHVPSSLTTAFNKLGHGINGYAKDFRNYVESLNEHRSGQSINATWDTRHTPSQHDNELFGIHWLKI
jgi:hypothetical protein